MSASLRRIRACMGINRRNIPVLILFAKNVCAKISADPQTYPNPSPSPQALLARVQAVEDAQPAVMSRTLGAAGFRDGEAKKLVTALELLMKYVQTLADDEPVESAASVIVGAGLKVASTTSSVSPPLAVRNTAPSGTISAKASRTALVGSRGAIVVFNWRFSTDGGTTWTIAESTGHTKTVLSGFARLTTVMVCVAVKIGSEPVGAWGPPVSVLVE